MSEALEGLKNRIREMIANNITGRAALEIVLKGFEELPEQQGACGVCLREVDHREPDGRYVGTEPIDVVRCANGCRGCSECVKVCEDGACSLAICQDCGETCEGCGERFCGLHIIDDPDTPDVWCGECCPDSIRRKVARIAAVIED